MMMDWKRIHTVMLDMDGTLLDLHFDNHFWQELVPKRYAESRGLDVPTAKSLLVPLFKKTEGTMEWYCLDYWTRELKLDIANLKHEVADLIALRPDTIYFLNWLRTHGKRTVLVTNAHQKSLALKLERTRLEHYIDTIICAHDIGVPKETSAFWSRLHQQLAFDKAHTLFIDDSLPVLNAAKAYGLYLVVAINNPSSRLPPKAIRNFPAISNFRELTDND